MSDGTNLHDVLLLAADGKEDLPDGDTSAGSVRLAESAAHTLLQPIGAGAREHLVDAQNVVRVHANAEVEGLLSGVLGHVLVGGDTGSLKSLAADVLLLETARVEACETIVVYERLELRSLRGAGCPCCSPDEVNAAREGVHGVALHADIEDANLGVCGVSTGGQESARACLELSSLSPKP